MRSETSLIKGVYGVEVSYYDGKNMVWEVIEDKIVKNTKDNSDIVLWGVDFDFWWIQGREER